MKLKLNATKSKCMVIGRQCDDLNISLVIDGEQLEQVSQMKYLGVIIDAQLAFKNHSEYVASKMAKKTNFLRRIRNRLDEKTSLLLFKSLIAPHYDFCSSVLFLMNDSSLRSLQLIQNRAMRIILNAPRDTSILRLLQRTKLLSVKQRITFNVLLFLYKATNNLLPPYICNQLNLISDVQPYQLRSNGRFRLPNMLTRLAQNSLMYKGVKEYNQMCERGVDTNQRLAQFKMSLETYVLEQFQYEST